MASTAGQGKAIPVFLVAGIVGLFVYYLTTRVPKAAAGPSQQVARMLGSAADPDKLAVAARGVRPWPKDAASRAALTPNPADRDQLDAVSLAEQFDPLLARARTDPAFAHTLAFALLQCAREDKAAEWLDINLRVGGDERDKRALERFDAAFSKCRGLSAAQMATRFELAEQAARAGVLKAQLGYSGVVLDAIQDADTPEAVDRYRYNAIAFIQTAARSGDPDGLYAAYKMYEFGYWVPQDRVRAYGYAEQFARVQPGEIADHMTGRLMRDMTADELRRARRR